MMNEKNGEEIQEPQSGTEIINQPETGSVTLPQDKPSIDNLLYLSMNIDKIVDAQNKIRMTLLRLAQEGDWVLFGSMEEGKAELGFAGAMRIASVMGVSFTNWYAERETGKDEKGEWYRWNMECDVLHGSRTVRAYGRAGSRDKFFGKFKGEFRPLHDIDEGNVKMVARRGAMKEGVKTLFGLHHMNPSDITKFGVKMDVAGGYDFNKGQAKKEKEVIEEHVTTIHIEEMFMKTGKKGNKEWKQYSIIDAEGKKYNTFDRKIADELKVLKTEGATVKIIYESGQFGNTIKAFEKVQ